jgi:tRNA dimethylallyltransferase
MLLPHQNTVIIIAGPTAVGKTFLAIQLAQHFNTKIISADSRQCFKELNIGVAKPTQEQLQLVPHYFIDSHSIGEEVNAGIFEQYALQATNAIFQDHKIAILVGGTGLYIKAFAEGIDSMPTIQTYIREDISTQYEQKGLAWLQQEIQIKDPSFWETAEQQNPQRLMRALEIVLATGNSINNYRTKQTVERPFNIFKIGIELPREKLIYNINQRVDAMINEGLVKEVEGLLPYQHLNALQTVGYKELFAYLNEDCTLPQAIEQIKINTRQYAKRQMTWFKKDKAFNWFTNDSRLLENILIALVC